MVDPKMAHSTTNSIHNNIKIPLLNPDDISAAVLYVLGTKPHVQVLFERLKYIFQKLYELNFRYTN